MLADLGTHWVTTYVSGTAHSTAANFHIRFSDDEGATWTDEDVYLDATPVVCPGHVPIVAPDGSILVFLQDAEKATCFRSTDGGKTWSALIQQAAGVDIITDEAFVYGTRVYACVIDRAVPLAPTLHLYISDNNGLAWSKLADMPTNKTGDEWSIATLDGVNFVAIKRDLDSSGTWASFSSDSAATWSDWQQITELGVVQKPTLRARAGGIMMVGRDGAFVAGSHSTGVWYSPDGGHTWSRHFHPDSSVFSDSGYCDVLQRADDNFYMLTYGGSVNAAVIRSAVFGIT